MAENPVYLNLRRETDSFYHYAEDYKVAFVVKSQEQTPTAVNFCCNDDIPAENLTGSVSLARNLI